MKLLIALSVLVACVSAKPFFFNHPLLSGLLGGGGSSSNAGASSFSSSEPAFVPAPSPPAHVSSAPAPNPLAGLQNLIAIPINIKKSLLEAHKAKFNKRIQGVLGAFQGLGSLGGSSSNAGASSFSSSNSISGTESIAPIGPSPIAPAPVSGLSSGSVDYNSYGGGESSYSSSGSQSFSSGSGLSSGGNVQTYHPQPAPNTNYHSEPVVLYLYPVDQSSSQASAGSSSVNYQPTPIVSQPDCNHPAPQPAPFVPQPAPIAPQPAPFVPQPAPIAPQPAPFVPEPSPYISEPIVPQQNYGPPNYEPSVPISSSLSSGTASSSSFDYEPQVIQEIAQPSNSYLPPSYKKRY